MRKFSVYTRIYSAHLEQQNAEFRILSDDIRNLTKKIDSDILQINEVLRSIKKKISQHLSMLSQLVTTQRDGTSRILEKTGRAFESLTKKQEDVQAISLHISEWSRSISHNVGEVVTSLQFHDITRQEMGKAKKAIDDIIQSIKSLNQGDTHEPEAHYMSLENKIIDSGNAIPGSLDLSRNKLVKAVDLIRQKLEEISLDVSSLTKKIHAIAGDTYEMEHSIISKIEDGLQTLIKTSEGICDVSNAIGLTSDSFREITAVLANIESIGKELEILSINANIKASQLGREGGGLEVIADAIQGVAYEAITLMKKTSVILASMISSTEDLSKSISSDIEAKKAGINQMAGDLSTLIYSLKKTNSDTHSLLNQMDKDGQVLYHDVENAVKTLTVHNKIDDAVSRIISRFSQSIKKMRLFESRIQSIAGTNTVEESGAVPFQRKSDEFGINVELF
jgi:methyl-accepting chemotaxis protein